MSFRLRPDRVGNKLNEDTTFGSENVVSVAKLKISFCSRSHHTGNKPRRRCTVSVLGHTRSRMNGAEDASALLQGNFIPRTNRTNDVSFVTEGHIGSRPLVSLVERTLDREASGRGHTESKFSLSQLEDTHGVGHI